MENKKAVSSILIEKRIEEVVGSFNAVKDLEEGVENWLKNEYPKPVLDNDLLKLLRERKVELGEKHKKLLHDWLSHEKIKCVFQEDERKLYY